MPREKALVTASVLKWAREAQGLDLATAAERLRRDVTEIESWETGEDAPTLPQARALAKLYRRPLAVFFLAEAPSDPRPPTLPDFRRLPGDVPTGFTPELRTIVRLAQLRQDWIRDELRQEGARPLSWVGTARTERNASKLASRIRKWLNVKFEHIEAIDSTSSALRYWIERVEDRRAFVFQSGGPSPMTVDVVIARGFAMVDKYAPFIMLNGADSETGRIFTLMHELAHLWIGEPGVSNLIVVDSPRSPAQRIEQFCNRVAAEVLVPSAAFNRSWQTRQESVRDKIDQLSRRFKVSREVISRRALESEFITNSTYKSLREEFIAERRERQLRQRSDGGPSWYLMVPKRAGYAMTRRALGAFADGRLTGTDLAELLNTKIGRLGDIAEHAGVPWEGWGPAA